jgi:hypothetical protein
MKGKNRFINGKKIVFLLYRNFHNQHNLSFLPGHLGHFYPHHPDKNYKYQVVWRFSKYIKYELRCKLKRK